MVKIAITMGDPAGVGPEIILKALNSPKLDKNFQAIIVGSERIVKKAAKDFDLPLPSIPIIEPCPFDAQNLQWGKLTKESGKLAAEAVILGANMAIDKKVDAIITAPINKEAINLAGFNYVGHTELLADLTHTKEFAMMLAGGKLRVVLVTTHMALIEACGQITPENIFSKIKITHDSLQNLWGISHPKIAVTALNPHGGEGGMFGDEEARIIHPAIQRGQELGINVIGPLASDTLFVQAKDGVYDAVICMYHDQALIPLKLVAFGRGINITLGLPIIRTSVDHGTAFDIAGKGIAKEGSLIEAINLACDLARKRKG